MLLASDPDYDGTNYYNEAEGASFSGQSITLSTPLPYSNSTVVISYTAGGKSTNTLQAMETDGETSVNALIGGERDSVDVTLGEGEAAVERNCRITWRDRDDNSAIEGMATYKDGDLVGTSDVNGRVLLGILAAGTYTIQGIKVGYQDNLTDGLNNESIVVA
jgi:hypothetical protein